MSDNLKTLSILHKFAEYNRQIISPWRSKLFYQKERPFIKDKDVLNNLELLEGIGALEKVIPHSNTKIWRAVTPYINSTNNIYELANEVNPVSCFCYSSALEVLRVTDQRFNTIHMYKPKFLQGTFQEINDPLSDILIPADTKKNEWHINEIPANIALPKVWDKYEISVHSIKNEWLFGIETREIQGVKVKTTDLERTLIDGLRAPKYCGGLNEVFKAWIRSVDNFDIDILVDYTERINSSIIYQRVGFVLEKIGFSHPSFDFWKQNKSPRGGSRLLNPNKEFSSNADNNWNLSINHPISILENKDADYS
jgi:predicted transcriptional regulator of viral defense system